MDAQTKIAEQDVPAMEMYDFLSQSTAQQFSLCKRKYLLGSILHIRRRPELCSLPIKLGSLWDKLMQYRYGGCPFSEVLKLIDEYQISDIEVARVKGIFLAHK